MNKGDPEQRFLGERVNAVEKQFSELCQALSALMRKSARLRDKTDDFAQVMRFLGSAEKISPQWSQGFVNLSNAFTLLADARDMEVKRLERKLIPDIVQYDAICRTVRDEVKIAGSVRQRSFHQDSKMSDLTELAESFEKRRLNDTRRVIQEFLAIELAMHAKSIEVLTAVYQDIGEIEDNADLDGFREKLEEEEPSGSVFLQKIRSQSMGALNTIAKHPGKRHSSLNSPYGKSQPALAGKNQPTLVTSREIPSDPDTPKSSARSLASKTQSLDLVQRDESITVTESESGSSEIEEEIADDPRSDKFKSKLSQLIKKPY
ncbi:protein FAM92A [Sergentomyia squamirostris]